MAAFANRTRRSPRTAEPPFAADPDAFEAFYRAHVEAIQRFIARRVGDRELAADLTADVFVAAIESATTYRETKGSPTAWLFGIARHQVAETLRRAGRERRATASVRGRQLLDPDDFARIADRLAAEAQSRRLYEAMDQLPDGERAVLELVALDSLSLAQAAAALGIRGVTARVRLHRARRRLRDQLTVAGAGEDLPRLLKPEETQP